MTNIMLITGFLGLALLGVVTFAVLYYFDFLKSDFSFFSARTTATASSLNDAAQQENYTANGSTMTFSQHNDVLGKEIKPQLHVIASNDGLLQPDRKGDDYVLKKKQLFSFDV